MYVLPCLSVVTMGYSRDLLDVCFGDQLVGSMNLWLVIELMNHIKVGIK